MRILKRRNLVKAPAWTLKVGCKHCKSELLVEEKDIKMEGVGGYSAFPERMIPTAKCPVCDHLNNLPNKKMPDRFKTLYGDGFGPATSRKPVD